ncbi:ribokinase [Streptomyces albipurpureus]|uniref:Ribokinase n=1 Tax=Streptomyces albipurpureus TaxID=2897419 RepID=A0ABT0UMA9_9ACTN|nr:ribokinase [Streptomyces sp. CWNU-1]MCM2389743.1 ribokinase [Streptomyces sp. CWNU-1]
MPTTSPVPDVPLVVVGSANVDLVVRVERRPLPGETVRGGDLAVHPGGKGANQAVAAARLGGRVTLLAQIGDDPHGELITRALRDADVDFPELPHRDRPTGTAMIVVGPEGDNSIVVSPGANARLSPRDIAEHRERLFAARVLSLQLEIPLATVTAAVRAAGPGTRVVLNPSPPADLPTEVLTRCDPLVLNQHEARYLSGSDATPEAAAEALLTRGPRSVVITLGAEGALVAEGDGTITRVPGVRVPVVDTTGAGDAFTAALAWRLSEGEGIVAAVRYAVRIGAEAVSATGAQSLSPRGRAIAAAGADGS